MSYAVLTETSMREVRAVEELTALYHRIVNCGTPSEDIHQECEQCQLIHFLAAIVLRQRVTKASLVLRFGEDTLRLRREAGTTNIGLWYMQYYEAQ